MKRYVCDRCGKLASEYDECGRMTVKSNLYYQDLRPMKRRTDLCGECTELFYKFIDAQAGEEKHELEE